MSLCVARTEKVGRSVAAVKGTGLTQRSYNQRVKAWCEYRHVPGEWEQECAWGQVGQLSARGTGTHSWVERNLQLSGAHGAWGTGQRDLVPCLGQQDSYFISSGGERATCTLSNLWLPRSAISDSSSRQGWARGKLLHPWRRLVWGKVGHRMKTACDKAQRNAVESYRIRLYCKGLIYRISVQFSHSVMSDSLRPHELQYARPPCPSPTAGVHPNSCPSSWWCHPAISSSVIPFSSCHQSLLASESFPMSQLFAWGSQSTGVSALASFLTDSTQGWSPLECTGWISLKSKGLSRVVSNNTVQKHQFFSAQLYSQSNSHIHTWQVEKP